MATEPSAVTERELLEKWGLYRVLHLNRDWDTPEKISRDCSICSKETTWKLVNSNKPTSLKVYALEYSCVDCEKERAIFFIYILPGWERVTSSEIPRGTTYRLAYTKNRLIGAYPAPSARIAKNLEKRLGDDAVLYKKGLNCRNEGFGIGAVAYIRRVVENKTNELIDVVADLAERDGLAGEMVEELRSAKEQKTYDKKLEVAAPLVPESLRPGEVNPLGQLHDLLSMGLHGKTEDECLQIADDLREIFEYVFERLHSDVEAHRTYKEKITGIANKYKKANK
jgi:hypothetical protein